MMIDKFYYLKWKLTDNYKYLKRYSRSNNLDDLEKYIEKSNNIDLDIEELVHWNRLYEWWLDGQYSHAHTLKEVFECFIIIYKYTPDAKIVLKEDTFHKDELIMVQRFIDILNGDRKVSPLL